MPGNPIPSFAVAMIAIGMILTNTLVLQLMVTGLIGEEDIEIGETSYMLGIIGIFLIIVGIWTIVDSLRKMDSHG